jgi:hypothetical protein
MVVPHSYSSARDGPPLELLAAVDDELAAVDDELDDAAVLADELLLGPVVVLELLLPPPELEDVPELELARFRTADRPRAGPCGRR